MEKHYDFFKTLVMICAFCGFYLPGIDKLFRNKYIAFIIKSLVIFPVVCLPLFMIFSFRYFYVEKKFVLKVFGFTQCIYTSYSSFAIISSLFIKSGIVRVFELWDSLFQEDLFEEDRQKLLKRKRRIDNAWIILFSIISIIVSIFYCFKPYFNEDKSLGHPSGIPYKRQTPDFEFVVTFELIAVVSSWTTIIAFDTMMMIFLSLDDCQFRHLKKSLGRIFESVSVTETGIIVVKEFTNENGETVETTWDDMKPWERERVIANLDHNIRLWLSHHQQILKFHNELNNLFAIPLTVKYLAFSLIICLFCFLTLVEGGFSPRDSLLGMTFLANNYSIFYVNTTIADSIRDNSHTLFEDAFENSWYIYPKEMRMRFMIIVMRTNQPAEFKVGRIFPFGSKTFLRVFTTAYSVFTFLLHILKT